ncbi:MAG: L,D-transpeptidase [Acidobacteriota bacterium]|nr:L,D-transpeptidase [Acidobacteriota bacterium]
MKARTLLLALTFIAALGSTAQESIASEGLPSEAPRIGTVITIDVSTNRAYLFKDGDLIRSSPAATGSDKVLRKGNRVWWFRTPRGKHTVVRKIVDPVWTKPDWAFIEEGKPVPPQDSPKRKEKGTMGKYALDLGERVMIHGTNDPKSIGRRVSHGCIRLPKAMLALLWKEAPVGTEVHIFESVPRLLADNGGRGLNDLDLE